MKERPKIAVIGLGKLGSCLAAILASKKYDVTGVDINKKYVEQINLKKPPVQENGLGDLLKRSGHFLKAHSDVTRSAKECEVIFIVVPTPSKADGSFSLKYMIDVCKKVGKGIQNNTCKYPLIVFTSTILPGDSEKYLIPVLEKNSQKNCGKGFGVCYNPEFIALGSVIKDMLNPDLVLIGESDKKSGDILTNIYSHLAENNAPIQRMNLINSEIVKISINTYVTTKISYANMLAEVCHQTPGANIDIVSEAIGKDNRIGSKYLKGGSPYGGPCFPRDNRAFTKMSKLRKVDAHIAIATDKMNDAHLKFILQTITGASSKIKKIGLLGLSYKPETWVVEESAGIKLAKQLIKKNYTVSFFDPQIKDTSIKKLNMAKDIKTLLNNNQMVVILNNDMEFKKLQPKDFGKNVHVIDCWRSLDKKEWDGYEQLISLGVGKIK